MNNAAPRVAASPGKAGAPDTTRALDTGAVTKRLQQELMGLMASSGDGVSAFPSGDSLFDWVGTITVSLESCWERVGLSFECYHSSAAAAHRRLLHSCSYPP